nr:hypothetical protein [Tanacetum cinerariifolium]
MGTINKTLFIKKEKDDIMLDKYAAEILKTFYFSSVKTTSTPIETQKPLVKDEKAADVDVHLYRSMIGSLMYLTASIPNITFAVYACSRFQVTPKLTHLHIVERIFMYLKGQPKLGLWLPRDSPFNLEAYSESDYAGANLDRKPTTREYVVAANYYGQVLWIQNQMLDYGFNFMNTKIYIDNESTICIVKNLVYLSKPKHIEIRHHFIRDSYEKNFIQFWNTATFKIVNSVKQIHVIVDGKAVVISKSSLRSDLLFNDEDHAQTRFETAFKQSHDLPLSKVNTSRNREDSMEHQDELTDVIPPTPHDSPLSGGHTPRSNEEEAKTTQDKMITILKLRVRRLEKKRKIRTSQPMKRRLFKGGVETSTDKSLDKGSGEKGGNTANQVSTARPEVSTATPSTPPTTTTIFGDKDLIIAQTLIKSRSDKAKKKGVAFRDVEEPPRLTRSTKTLQPLLTIDPKDKELAQRIYEEELAELDRAQKERQKQEEATIAALTEEFDKFKPEWMLIMHLLRKKQLAAERVEAIRNKPPTRTKVRNIMITYLKHMEQESAKSVEEESTDYEHEKEELRMWLTVVSYEEETVDPEILSTKYPIVDWESHILENVDTKDVHVYKIIRANENTSYHKSLSGMMRKFDRPDLVDLHRLVMKRFKDNTLKEKRYPLIKEMLEKMLN